MSDFSPVIASHAFGLTGTARLKQSPDTGDCFFIRSSLFVMTAEVSQILDRHLTKVDKQIFFIVLSLNI